MVDAFPLPRHRENSRYARPQYSRKGAKLNSSSVRRRSATAITRAILGDIQRAVEQLQLNMSTGSYDGSHNSNSWHKNAWRRLPKMGKKSFEGWPVREVADGHAVSSRPTPSPIGNASPNGHKRRPNITERVREGHSEYGFVPAAQRVASPQNTDGRASQPSAQIIHRTSNLQDVDDHVVGVFPSPPTSFSSFGYGYPNSPETRFSVASPLTRSHSAPYSPTRERLYAHPTEWTVEETVNWLRSKGFEDIVCEKFIEQETAGDALLNLDATSLKTDIGIIPYGKRFRIANAIEDLRRVANIRFPLVKQPTGPSSPSHGDLPPRAGFKPLILRCTSMGDLVSPPSLARPIPGRQSKSPMLLPFREPRPDVRSPVEKPTESDAKARAMLPSHSPRSGQDKTVERPLRITSFRSDGALAMNAKRAAIRHEGEKRDNALRCDGDTIYLATQRHPRLDEISSPSAHKWSMSPSMELATSPRVAPLKSRSPLLRERCEDHSDTPSEISPRSTLVGTPGVIPKSRQSSFGNYMASSPSLSLDDDLLYRKEGKHETHESISCKVLKGKSPTAPRRSVSLSTDGSLCASTRTSADTLLVRVGRSDHEGWMRKKGGHFSTWKTRFLVLKGPYLFWLADDNPQAKVEGHVNIVGCRIVPDESIDPGSYGFKLLRGSDDVHFFSSDDQTVVREWMKALLKPNIKRDLTQGTVFPTDLQVVSLESAQAMDPRPPSPNSAAATQRALRREGLNKLPTREGGTLTKMRSVQALSSSHDQEDSGRPRSRSFTSGSEMKCPVPLSKSIEVEAPVRPPRNKRRDGLIEPHSTEQSLIKWANGHLPGTQISPRGSICSGLELLQIADSIKDIKSRHAPEDVLSRGPDQETLEGLFSLVDFLVGEQVKSGAVDFNDLRRSKRDKIFQMLRGLRAWERHRSVI